MSAKLPVSKNPQPLPAASSSSAQPPPTATSAKSIVVCLNPSCPTPFQRYLQGLRLSNHSDSCKLHIFGIEALLEASESVLNESYPVEELGKVVKSKLEECARRQMATYTDVLIEDFRHTVNRMLDRFKQELGTTFAEKGLKEAYEKVFSLQAIKDLLSRQGTSAQLTTLLLTSRSAKNLDQLKQTNNRLDELNRHLNNLIDDMASILLHYQRDTAIVRKDIVQRRNPLSEQKKQLTEVAYGMVKSTYLHSEHISVDNSWIRFPQADQNHFKPWVYAEKGFSEGVHKMLVVATLPGKNLNCGIGVLQHQDLNSYPYATYKSLYDRVAREFRLLKGVEIHTFMDGNTQVELTMDLDHKKVILRDMEDRCQYVAKLREAVVYYFVIVGELWNVRVLHLT